MKKYRLIVTKEDTETGEVEELHNGMCINMTILAENKDGECMELIVSDSVANIAAKLASSSTARRAVKLAWLMMSMKEQEIEEMEDSLSDSIGGIQ